MLFRSVPVLLQVEAWQRQRRLDRHDERMLGRIGIARRDQPLDEGDHLRDMLGGFWLHRRRQAVECRDIRMELRRDFRDYGWKVHVPRSIRDIRQQIKGATTELTQRLGRTPNTTELAEALSVAPEQITEGLLAANAYQPQSLDTPVVDSDDNPQSLADVLGDVDAGFERVTERESVKPALQALPPREQRILYLRFFASKTQRQIADTIGASRLSSAGRRPPDPGDRRGRRARTCVDRRRCSSAVPAGNGYRYNAAQRGGSVRQRR